MHDFKHTVLRLRHLTSFSDIVNLLCTVAHLVQHYICNVLRMRGFYLMEEKELRVKSIFFFFNKKRSLVMS